MRKPVIYFVLILVLCEIVSRSFLFFYNTKLSYQINKNYYQFSGSFYDFLNVYKKYDRFIHRSVIFSDIFNRKLYIPNVDKIELGFSSFQTNSFGILGGTIPLDRAKGIYRIICIGSSYILSDEDNNAFALLEKKLTEKYKSNKFQVINAGVSGQNIINSFMSFALNLRVLKPDVIIINNVPENIKLANLPFHINNYKKIEKLGMIVIDEQLRSNIGVYGIYKLISSKLSPRYNLGLSKEASDCYEAFLESFVLLAKGMGSKVVLLSCGIAVDKQHNFERENYNRKWLEWRYPEFTINTMLEVLDGYNKIMKKVAERNNVIFIDMSEIVPKDNNHFLDATHRSDKGNEIFANFLADRLSNLFEK